MCPLRLGLDVADNLEPRLEQIRLTMALAFELGPRLVIIQPGPVPVPLLPPGEGSGVREPDDPRFPLMKESLEALGRHGDRTGVTLALDSQDQPETLIAYLNRIDVGSLAINFNPANLVLAGHNPHDAVKTYLRRLVHAQARDARRISPSKIATVPLGHGDIDWMQLLADFGQIEYRGCLSVQGSDGPELAAGVAFLRRFVT